MPPKAAREPSEFGRLLKYHRRRTRLTQKQLADRTTVILTERLKTGLASADEANVSRRTISDIEAGKTLDPHSTTASMLARALPITDEERLALLDAARPPAPVALPASPRHNLPLARASFVGRQRELTRLQSLLPTTRLLTLVGMGGGGKTRLALEGARDLAADYADEIWWVDLIPVTDAAEIARAIMAAAGARLPEHQSPHEALPAWAATRNLLLILDNCEHVHHACAEVVDALLAACPGVRVLATSRRPLGLPGERVWRLAPLTVPSGDTPGQVRGSEAVQLLLERAGDAFTLTDANAASVAMLCRRLDGLPLALELAAPHLGALGAAALVARLDERFALLYGAPVGRPARHRSLRVVLDWSHDLLAPPERCLFRRVGVFVGGFTLDAAEVVDRDPDTAARLTSLVDHSLVAVEGLDPEVRYSLPETIRAYARERLEQAGEASAIEACRADWCIALAEQVAAPLDGGPAVAGWLASLSAEAGNLRAALAWAATSAPATGLRLAGAAWPYYYLRGDYAAGRVVLRAALDAAGADSAARTRPLYGLGVISLFDDLLAARACLEEALERAERTGDTALVTTAHWSLAYVGVQAGELGEAQRHLEAAEELVAGDDRPGSHSRHRMLRGQVLIGTGDLARGRSELAAAYDDALAADQLLYQAMTLALLGGVSLRLGLVGEAIDEFTALDQTAERLGSWFYRTVAKFRLGMAREWLGELDAAAADYGAAIVLADEAGGNRLERVNALLGLGRIALYRGDAAGALAPLAEAAALHATLKYRLGRRSLDYALGLALWHTGRVAPAAARLSQALDLPLEAGGGGAVAACLEGLAGLVVAAGDMLPAARWLGAAEALRGRECVPRPRVDARAHAATVSAAQDALGADGYARALHAGARGPVDDAMMEARAWLAAR